jgi:predicted  nucleic acid-binding Zn-ribbon protein
MYSAEVLSQLRSLNWLTQELQRLSPASPEAVHLQAQVAGLRSRLPYAILSYHDRLCANNKPSVVEISGEECGYCSELLAPVLRRKLITPGRF